MANHKKERIIKNNPRVKRFSPRGYRGRPDIVRIALDEFESIRLADQQELKNLEAASCMGVSRQTFERILKKARQKIAEAIVEGKIIQIEE